MNRSCFFLTTLWVFFALAAKAQQFDTKSQLKQHVGILASDSLEGRGLGTEGKDKAKRYIVSQFKDAGIQPFGNDYPQPFSVRMELAWIKGNNIVGMVKGSDPVLSNEYILIGAHYDHLGYEVDGKDKTIYPGADDNASGVASIIEIGRYFAQNPQLAKRSLLVVAFDGEESGLLGSQHFVSDTLMPISHIKAMFSFDMVGMLEDYQGLDLLGMATIRNGKTMAEGLAVHNEIVLKSVNGRIAHNTDTSPFGNIGIPAVHVFTGTLSPYHQPGDKSDLLDYDGMLKINVFMSEVIAGLLQDESLAADPKFLADTVFQPKVNKYGIEVITLPKDKRIRAGFRMNYGFGRHDYNDDFFVAKPVFNFEGGLYSQIDLSKAWALQPEILYNYNGSKHNDGRFTRHSVTVPLNLMLGNKSDKPTGVRGFVFAGPYYQYNFGGSIGDDIDLDFDTYNRSEWGYSWGLLLHSSKVQIGWVFRNGITSISKDPLPKMTSRSSMFVLGINFGK
ncbi:MAG: M28 family peptidase [Breznakibacter sp.]